MSLLRETTNSLLEQNLLESMGKYGKLLVACFYCQSEDDVSLNEQMITEGYAWEYDGTKKKDFEEPREIRRSLGTLDAG